MKYQVKILSGETDNSTASVVVAFDDCHYLFNCGEGSQRIFINSGHSFGKLGNVFVSSSKISRSAGLPGVMLSVADSWPDTKLNCHGPEDIRKMKKQLQLFTNNVSKNMIIKPIKSDGICYKDHNLTVKAFITRVQSGKKRKNTLDESVIQYICQGPYIRGKFSREKALELGLKPGANYRLLTEGQSVQAPDGSIITPDQVMGPGKEGTFWMFLEFPSIEHLQQIKQLISEYSKVKFVFISCAKELSKTSEFKDFIIEFPSSVDFFVFDRATSSNALIFYKSRNQLANLDSKVFPSCFSEDEINHYSYKDRRVLAAQAGTCIVVEPKYQIEASASSTASNVLHTRVKPSTEPEELTVYPLGTGSAIPSISRNVSSHLVAIPNAFYLLDVGEGTLGQITRLFGSERVDSVLAKLVCIFISHTHADHHFGLASIVKKWLQVNSKGKLFLICNGLVYSNLNLFTTEELDLSRVVWIDLNDLNHLNSKKLTDADLTAKLKLKTIQTVPVFHNKGSHAVVFDHYDHGKLVFSGDCRPSDLLAKVGQDCTLLVHEATFEDKLAEEAKYKHHCTISEALQVAKNMNAKNVLLTHFSQRYAIVPQQIPVIDGMNICLAHDLMVLSISSFPRIAALNSKINSLFSSIYSN